VAMCKTGKVEALEKRLAGEMEHHAGILAYRITHEWVTELGNYFTCDVNLLVLKSLQMRRERHTSYRSSHMYS
jgi:hypothetical protein